MLLLNVHLQAEQVAGANLGGATVGTLQVCLQRNLVEILDFQSLRKEEEVSLRGRRKRRRQRLL